VIGVPSERYGDEVMAWIKLGNGATLTEQDLVAACHDVWRGRRPLGRGRAGGDRTSPWRSSPFAIGACRACSSSARRHCSASRFRELFEV